TCVFLLLLLTGCANLLNMPPPHTGDQILGGLELRFFAPVGENGSEIAVTLPLDLRRRTWPGLRSQGTTRYLQYILEGRRLLIELEDETRQKIQGGMTVAYDEQGNMISHNDPKASQFDRMILLIEGDFENREGETISGVFIGTIQQALVRRTYERRTQRWIEDSRVLWTDEVEGILMKDGREIDRLRIRPRR
ncbi:hypothetical protein ACFL6T_01330, partial [Candidatus Zixiibacteriota bacterium]